MLSLPKAPLYHHRGLGTSSAYLVHAHEEDGFWRGGNISFLSPSESNSGLNVVMQKVMAIMCSLMTVICGSTTVLCKRTTVLYMPTTIEFVTSTIEFVTVIYWAGMRSIFSPLNANLRALTAL